jgi:hypothetical protein
VSHRDTAAAFALSLFAGLLLWSLTAFLSHRREPWDAESYWTIAYPLATLLSAGMAALYPSRPWRWAATIIFSQLAVMLASGSDFSLLPLGLVLLALLSLPAIAAALVAAWLRTEFLSRQR